MLKFMLLVVVVVAACGQLLAHTQVSGNWHAPEKACSVFADIPGMETKGYKNYPDVSKDYWCASPYKEIGTGFPMANNLAYYVTGNEREAKELKLVLNVNSVPNAEAGHHTLAVASFLLTKRALNAELSDEVLAALKFGKPGRWRAGVNYIEISRESWGTANGGYEIHFTIR